MAPAHLNRTGVPQGVVALEAAEVLEWGPIGKAIAWAGRDAQRVGEKKSDRPIVCGALVPRGGATCLDTPRGPAAGLSLLGF
jgi:hypothetical protein